MNKPAWPDFPTGQATNRKGINMTMVDDTWTPEVHTPPGRADGPVDGPSPWEQVCTPRISVEAYAKQLADHIGSFINGVADPLDRYLLRQRWRSVYERVAAEMTFDGGVDLLDMKNAGHSPKRISELLEKAGCPLSKSGVELAIRRSLSASVEEDAEMQP